MTDVLSRLAALTATTESSLLPCPFCGGAAVIDYYKTAGKYVCAVRCSIHCATRSSKCGVEKDPTEAIRKWNTRPREAALIALAQEAATESKRLREFMDFIRMKAEWRFQGSDFVSEEDPAYPRVSEAAIAATAYIREILAIAQKALNPQKVASKRANAEEQANLAVARDIVSSVVIPAADPETIN